MARFNHGVFSKAKGKLAGVVFQQYEGMQIGKEYQPNVKNPQTENQVISRAKLKAASTFIAAWWEVFKNLMFVEAYERFQRGAAVAIAYANSIYNPSQGGAAAINITDAVAALNNGRFNSSGVLDIAWGTGYFTATLSGRVPTVGGKVYGVVIGYDDQQKVITKAIQAIDTTAQGAYNLMPTTSENATGYSVMAIEVDPLTENGRAILSSANVTSSQWSIVISRALRAGDIEVTPVAYSFHSM